MEDSIISLSGLKTKYTILLSLRRDRLVKSLCKSELLSAIKAGSEESQIKL